MAAGVLLAMLVAMIVKPIQVLCRVLSWLCNLFSRNTTGIPSTDLNNETPQDDLSVQSETSIDAFTEDKKVPRTSVVPRKTKKDVDKDDDPEEEEDFHGPTCGFRGFAVDVPTAGQIKKCTTWPDKDHPLVTRTTLMPKFRKKSTTMNELEQAHWDLVPTNYHIKNGDELEDGADREQAKKQFKDIIKHVNSVTGDGFGAQVKRFKVLSDRMHCCSCTTRTGLSSMKKIGSKFNTANCALGFCLDTFHDKATLKRKFGEVGAFHIYDLHVLPIAARDDHIKRDYNDRERRKLNP